jgi:hypothetical protein
MIVHGYIEIHSKGYEEWIIIMRFKVLLITHYPIREILVETVFDVYVIGARIKNLSM